MRCAVNPNGPCDGCCDYQKSRSRSIAQTILDRRGRSRVPRISASPSITANYHNQLPTLEPDLTCAGSR
ncbi:DUF6464 family protein [Microcoleus sp. herbarium12]|uniref:DUF6464 family protein n=1 Tax=Microcoleus sp. herbarium12 TaxID=3055437 RepID=UPI003FA53BDC